jgi:hypothetical protein
MMIAVIALVILNVSLIVLLLVRGSSEGGGDSASSGGSPRHVISSTPNRSSHAPSGHASRSSSPSSSPSFSPSSSPEASPTRSPSATSSPFATSSPQPSSQPAGPQIVLRLATRSTSPGEAVAVTGRYTGAEPGTSLVIQRRSGGRWQRFPVPAATRDGGRFSSVIQLIEPGRYELRVADPAARVVSGVALLRVR